MKDYACRYISFKYLKTTKVRTRPLINLKAVLHEWQSPPPFEPAMYITGDANKTWYSKLESEKDFHDKMIPEG